MLRKLVGRTLKTTRTSLTGVLASPKFKRSADHLQQYVEHAKSQFILNNKGEKEEEDDDDDEENKKKSFNEQVKEFFRDPNKRNYTLLFIGSVLVALSLSENIKDIIGVEFFMYPNIGVAELEELISKGNVASIRVLAFTGDYNDEYKALVITKEGQKKVFNVINPDSFINFISEIQSKNGRSISEQIPFKLDHKTPLYKNLSLCIQVAHHMMMVVLFVTSVIIIKRFVKDMASGIGGKSSLA